MGHFGNKCEGMPTPQLVPSKRRRDPTVPTLQNMYIVGPTMELQRYALVGNPWLCMARFKWWALLYRFFLFFFASKKELDNNKNRSQQTHQQDCVIQLIRTTVLTPNQRSAQPGLAERCRFCFGCSVLWLGPFQPTCCSLSILMNFCKIQQKK